MYLIKQTKQEPFRFRLNGRQRSVPALSAIPLAMARRFAEVGEGDAGAATDAFMELFERYAPGVTDEVDAEQFSGLVAAYVEFSGVGAGE
ncbi:hypothetical protein HLV35_07535 [Eggerthellaceae bacterium zg-997]|nr:hypothetical protein [Eggerthellaceae bacterium zg-997]